MKNAQTVSGPSDRAESEQPGWEEPEGVRSAGPGGGEPGFQLVEMQILGRLQTSPDLVPFFFF